MTSNQLENLMHEFTQCCNSTGDEVRNKLKQCLKKIKSILKRQDLIKQRLIYLIRNKLSDSNKDTRAIFDITINNNPLENGINLRFRNSDIIAILTEYEAISTKANLIRQEARQLAMKIGFLKPD